MNANIAGRWKCIDRMTIAGASEYLKRDWAQSSVDKWVSITPDSNTAKKILAQFNVTKWKTYKAYSSFANWEYMVLLKLVHLKLLEVKVGPCKGANACYREDLVKTFPADAGNPISSYMLRFRKTFLDVDLKPVSFDPMKTLPRWNYDVIVHSFAGMQGALAMKVKAGSEQEALDIADIRLNDLLESCDYTMIIG